jgi:CheY-like chemotaxis protein
LIILDLNMPSGIDGFQTAVELKKDRGGRATRRLLPTLGALTHRSLRTSRRLDSDT